MRRRESFATGKHEQHPLCCCVSCVSVSLCELDSSGRGCGFEAVDSRLWVDSRTGLASCATWLLLARVVRWATRFDAGFGNSIVPVHAQRAGIIWRCWWACECACGMICTSTSSSAACLAGLAGELEGPHSNRLLVVGSTNCLSVPGFCVRPSLLTIVTRWN